MQRQKRHRMKRLLHRALFVVALLVGTVVTSCAAYTPSPADTATTIQELSWIHVINNRSEAVHVTAVWSGGRKVLGEVVTGGNQVYSLDVDNGRELQMELRLEDGYKCITYPVFAWPGQMLTLRLWDGFPDESFCTPIGVGRLRDRQA